MTSLPRASVQARWQALTEGDRPTLPVALRFVQHTFLDPVHPELTKPPETLLELFETRALYLPRLDWLGLVALAALSHPHRSLSRDSVCLLVRRLSMLFAETALALGGEQHVVPAVHYRPGFLRSRRPGSWSEQDVRLLEDAYHTGLRAIERWLALALQPEAVLAHRLPALATPLDVLAQRLPAELHVVLDRLRASQDESPHALALSLLSDEASTLGVPWTGPLLTWMADLLPAKFTVRRWKVLRETHNELLVRWRLAGSPPALDDLPRSTLEEEHRSAVRAYRSISKELEEKAGRNPKESWRRSARLPYRGPLPGWALLEGRVDPRLLRLCEAVVPSGTLEGGVPEIIIGFLADQPREREFLIRLTLMAVALMFERLVVPSGQHAYLSVVERYLRRIFTHSTLKPEDFSPAVHLLDLFRSSGASAGAAHMKVRERMQLDTCYAACARAVDTFIAAHPADADWLNMYHYGRVPDELIQELRQKWYKESKGIGVEPAGPGERLDVLNDTQSAIVENYDRIMILAELRYVLVRELIYQIRQIQYDSRLAGAPYPWKVDFQVPNHDSTWHFQLWEPAEFARLHVQAGRTVKIPMNGRMFLEFVSATARDNAKIILPWFLEHLQMRTRSEKDRAEYLERNQETEISFGQMSSFQNAPYLHQEFKAFIRAVTSAAPDTRFDQRCYADPDELYMEVLTAICFLRFSRTTGSRIHEFLQLRLDFMQKIKADGRPINALPGELQGETVWVTRLSPKGKKGRTAAEDELADTYVDDSVQSIVAAIALLRENVEGKIALAAPQNIAVLHQESARYVIQNGKNVLPQRELMRRVKFLLLGWQVFSGGSTDIHLISHPLRNGFVHTVLKDGTTIEDLRPVLNHSRTPMSAWYARSTKSQAAKLDGSLLMPLDEQNRLPVGGHLGTRAQPRRKADRTEPVGTFQQLLIREEKVIELEEVLRQLQGLEP